MSACYKHTLWHNLSHTHTTRLSCLGNAGRDYLSSPFFNFNVRVPSPPLGPGAHRSPRWNDDGDWSSDFIWISLFRQVDDKKNPSSFGRQDRFRRSILKTVVKYLCSIEAMSRCPGWILSQGPRSEITETLNLGLNLKS